jgi:hypothetical protein
MAESTAGSISSFTVNSVSHNIGALTSSDLLGWERREAYYYIFRNSFTRTIRLGIVYLLVSLLYYRVTEFKTRADRSLPWFVSRSKSYTEISMIMIAVRRRQRAYRLSMIIHLVFVSSTTLHSSLFLMTPLLLEYHMLPYHFTSTNSHCVFLLFLN